MKVLTSASYTVYSVPTHKEVQSLLGNYIPATTNLIDTDGDGFGDQIIDPSKNSGLPNKRRGKPSANP